MAGKGKRNPTEKKQPRKARNLSPGTVKYIGRKTATVTTLDIIDYSKEHYERFESQDIKDAFKYEDASHITWINVNGLNNQEDIVTTHQRPKIEEYEGYLFLVFKMLHYNKKEHLVKEHVSMVMGKDYVLTFQEAEGDVFNDLRERLEHAKGRIRGSGADYLM